MATILNKNFNPNLPESATNQRFVFSEPTVINQQTGQMSITPSSLQQNQPIEVPEGNTPDTSALANGTLAGAQYYTTPSGAVVDAQGNLITPPASNDTTNNTNKNTSVDNFDSLLKSYLGGAEAPEAMDPIAEWKKAMEADDLKKQNAEVMALSSDLANLKAQQNILNARAARVPIQLQEEAEGRGITKAGLAPIETGELRKIALQQLPITEQILTTTAQLEIKQGAYDKAVSTIEKLLGLQWDVYKDKKETWNTLYNRAYDKATKEQQQQMDKVKEKKDEENKRQEDFFDLRKSYINLATKEGDYDIAAKMAMAKDESELARLLVGIKKAPKKLTQTEITHNLQTSAYAKARPFLEQSRGTDGYVDPQVYMQLRSDYAEAIGDPSDFDAVFASYLSPYERDRLGVGKESYTPAKTTSGGGEIINPFD